MATLIPLERLSDEESADLRDRVQRFRGAWQKDGSTGLGRYVPPPGVRHRLSVLVQVVLIDMELRAAAGLSFDLDSYIGRFPEDLSTGTIPVALLAHEYRLRHQFGDQPDMSEYRGRYPLRYEELVRYFEQTPTPSGGIGTQPDAMHVVSEPTHGTLDGSRGDTAAGSKAIKGLGDLVATQNDSIDKALGAGLSGTIGTGGARRTENSSRTGGTGGTTILPHDAPYHLVRKIGSGAFGEVFEALAPGGVRVAVKRILRSVDHPTSLSEREALDTIKNLSHPYLLKTSAYWVFDDRLIVVMELADGSLAGRIDHYQGQGRLGVPPEELIPLVEQAADALDYLHSQNVSHRDIKPENILILKGYAKVGDFGLARPHEHAMTVVGNTVGTPAYMAPEMWQQKVSLQSDQYSLAATYVRARLGRPLYETTVLLEMAHFHVHEVPDLNPLSGPEQVVLLRALAKDPDDRFPTCAEFARALRAAVLEPAALTGERPALARTGKTGPHRGLPPDPGAEPELELAPDETPPRRRRRRPYEGVLGILVVAVACALAVGAMNWFMKRDTTVEKPEKDDKVAKYPNKWTPDEAAGTRVINDRHYHNRLTRTVADEQLVALLVYPTRPNDIPPFYMLENKITNRVFLDMWNSAVRSQSPLVLSLRENHALFVPEEWRLGAEDNTKKEDDPKFRLGIEGSQVGVPVTSVTLPEAVIVAQELGGQLPTPIQWKKAAGMFGDDLRSGPAGPDVIVPPDLKGEKAQEFRVAQLRQRNLALGLDRGPQPVEKRTNDVSEPFKIHQLFSNGQEWLGVDDAEHVINLSNIPVNPPRAYVAGWNWYERSVPTFKTFQTLGTQPWGAVGGARATGLRIVIVPQ